jgi:hypothetical protein
MGNDDLDQLDKIFVLCGTPTEASWPEFKNLPIFKDTIKNFSTVHSRTLHSKFQQ